MGFEYKEIEGFEKYFINILGQIKNKRGLILKSTIGKDGYYRIGLSNSIKQKNLLTHRLIALNFIPNPKNLPFVNHKDGNKQNNNISNLEWCTASENLQHALNNKFKIPINGVNHFKSKLSENDVLEIRKSNLKTTDLGVLYGVTHRTISAIKLRKQWKHI